MSAFFLFLVQTAPHKNHLSSDITSVNSIVKIHYEKGSVICSWFCTALHMSDDTFLIMHVSSQHYPLQQYHWLQKTVQVAPHIEAMPPPHRLVKLLDLPEKSSHHFSNLNLRRQLCRNVAKVHSQ